MKNLNHRRIFIIKTSNIIIASIVASIFTAVSFADNSNKEFEPRMQAQDVAVIMLGGHDINNDGALDTMELASSIENLYGMRQEAMLEFRDNLGSKGVISQTEGSKGIITLALCPKTRQRL